MIGAQTVTRLTGIPVSWADKAAAWVIPFVVVSRVVTALAIVPLVPALRTPGVTQLLESRRR